MAQRAMLWPRGDRMRPRGLQATSRCERLVTASAVDHPGHPVADDERQAHDHEDEAQCCETRRLKERVEDRGWLLDVVEEEEEEEEEKEKVEEVEEVMGGEEEGVISRMEGIRMTSRLTMKSSTTAMAMCRAQWKGFSGQKIWRMALRI
ncbi:hypothetical protein CRUP_032900 [Coryphaenoides rupestris]|nr:hypothetical protein CRUP_032900 [Coryphaenoides rupestris]